MPECKKKLSIEDDGQSVTCELFLFGQLITPEATDEELGYCASFGEAVIFAHPLSFSKDDSTESLIWFDLETDRQLRLVFSTTQDVKVK